MSYPKGSNFNRCITACLDVYFVVLRRSTRPVPRRINKKALDRKTFFPSRTNINYTCGATLICVKKRAFFRIPTYPRRLTYAETLQNTPRINRVWLHPPRSICKAVSNLILILAGSLCRLTWLYLRINDLLFYYYNTIFCACQRIARQNRKFFQPRL